MNLLMYLKARARICQLYFGPEFLFLVKYFLKNGFEYYEIKSVKGHVL
jgi:hypothetical protein